MRATTDAISAPYPCGSCAVLSPRPNPHAWLYDFTAAGAPARKDALHLFAARVTWAAHVAVAQLVGRARCSARAARVVWRRCRALEDSASTPTALKAVQHRARHQRWPSRRARRHGASNEPEITALRPYGREKCAFAVSRRSSGRVALLWPSLALEPFQRRPPPTTVQRAEIYCKKYNAK